MFWFWRSRVSARQDLWQLESVHEQWCCFMSEGEIIWGLLRLCKWLGIYMTVGEVTRYIGCMHAGVIEWDHESFPTCVFICFFFLFCLLDNLFVCSTSTFKLLSYMLFKSKPSPITVCFFKINLLLQEQRSQFLYLAWVVKTSEGFLLNGLVKWCKLSEWIGD